MDRTIVLHPRAAPGNMLRVWLGAGGYRSPPQVQWELDGVPAVSHTVRRLGSARDLPDGSPPDRVFTGLFEFRQGIAPGSFHRVVAQAEAGVEATLVAQTVPDEVPSGLNRWFNVLLISCYYQRRDKNDLVGTMIPRIPVQDRPHLSILMGDQVYLDLPPLRRIPDEIEALEQKFQGDYVKNWFNLRGYGSILNAAPSVSVPDDHEYWNNYPEKALWTPNTHEEDSRKNWSDAAHRMYEAFQLHEPGGLLRAFELDVPPLSFFCMDNRSTRERTCGRSMPRQVLNQYRNWVARVVTSNWNGVLATGQPMFERPSGCRGTDFVLADFTDFGPMAEGVAEMARHGRSVILLTGDRHWGRVVRARPQTAGSGDVFEVMVSPSRLVSTPAIDQLRDVAGFFRGLFGRGDPWSRHSKPRQPPPYLAHDHLGKAFGTKEASEHGQKGDQLAILSFQRTGPSLRMRVTYYPVTSDPDVARPCSPQSSPYKLA